MDEYNNLQSITAMPVAFMLPWMILFWVFMLLALRWLVLGDREEYTNDDRVMVHGIKKNKRVNGKRGIIRKPAAGSGRYIVQLDSNAGTFSFASQNLCRDPDTTVTEEDEEIPPAQSLWTLLPAIFKPIMPANDDLRGAGKRCALFIVGSTILFFTGLSFFSRTIVFAVPSYYTLRYLSARTRDRRRSGPSSPKKWLKFWLICGLFETIENAVGDDVLRRMFQNYYFLKLLGLIIVLYWREFTDNVEVAEGEHGNGGPSTEGKTSRRPPRTKKVRKEKEPEAEPMPTTAIPKSPQSPQTLEDYYENLEMID